MTAGLAVPALVQLPAFAATLTVNSTADGHEAASDAVCETVTGNGICTLRAAIELANANGGANTIGFSVNGTFLLSLGELHITNSPAQTLTIAGNGQALTVVDANNASRVFEIDSGASLTMSGVTVQHGSAIGLGGGDGGGIRNAGTLKLSNSLVSSNAASDIAGGGGISNLGLAVATLNTVTIDSNTATASNGADGGGIESFGLLTFVNGTVSNNQVLPITSGGGGGGIGIDGNTQSTTLTNLDIHDNSAPDGGGIVDNSLGSSLTNVTLRANHATRTRTAAPLRHRPLPAVVGSVGSGGGFADFSFGFDTLTNVTVDGNTATGNGGGIADGSGAGLGLQLRNVTIANNAAGGLGGGLISELGPDNLSYTVLSANTPTNCAAVSPGTVVSAGQNVENGTSCGFSAPADKPSTDPLLIPLANNPGPNAFVPPTDAVPANSPAVDFSPAGTCPPPATDERGVTRPQGIACDSGAYELIQAGPPPPPKCDKDGDGMMTADKHHHHHCRDKDRD